MRKVIFENKSLVNNSLDTSCQTPVINKRYAYLPLLTSLWLGADWLSVSKAHMYRCICKRCGHRVNRLFVNPLQIGKRWVVTCPACRHKTDLPDFAELSSKVIHTAKCLTPIVTAATRSFTRRAGGKLGSAGAASANLAVWTTAAMARLRSKQVGAKVARRRELAAFRLIALHGQGLLPPGHRRMRSA